MKKTALGVALGTAIGVTALTVSATDVGQLMKSGNGKARITVHYDHNQRDVEQKGTQTLYDEDYSSEFIDSDTVAINSESEALGGITAEEMQDHLYAKISYAVTPKIEIYGKLGVARAKLKDLRVGSFTETDTERFEDEEGNVLGSLSESTTVYNTEGSGSNTGSGSWGLLSGVGTKIQLHEWPSGLKAAMDMSYLYKEADVDDANLPGGGEMAGETHEWQVALMLSKDIGKWSTYGGAKYGKSESTYSFSESEPGSTDLVLENENPFGLFGGFEYPIAPNVSIGAEGRFGDEAAINLNIHWEPKVK